MLRIADALNADGYAIRVVSTRFLDWATDADTAVRRTRHWPWVTVDYSRRSGNRTRVWSGLRMRAVGVIGRAIGTAVPLSIAGNAYSRVHSELVRAIRREPADLIYAGTGTALAAAAAASRRTGVPYALDLEDFHSGENGDADPARDALAEKVERRVLPGARFLTTASEPMQAAYRAKYGVAATVIHNVLPLPSPPQPRSRPSGDPLRLYWFSQTIGTGRGLESAVRACGLLSRRCELHLRGREAHGCLDSLRDLQRSVAPLLTLEHHPPAPPDDMVRLCAGYDVGLATELPTSPNKVVCISNKIFTYLAAGLPVASSDTPGQRVIAEQDPQAVRLFRPDDAASLAELLRCWTTGDDAALSAASRAAWNAAARRWHWEHAEEQGALIALVRGALTT